MGGLRLYAFEKKSNINFGEEKLLWEIHGNQGRKWNTKRVTYRPRRNVEVFNKSKSKTKVIFCSHEKIKKKNFIIY